MNALYQGVASKLNVKVVMIVAAALAVALVAALFMTGSASAFSLVEPTEPCYYQWPHGWVCES